MPWNLFPTKRPTISKTTLDLLFLFGLILLFYGSPFLNPMKISYGGDAFSLFLPAVSHYRDAMYHGIIPLWNPNTWIGAPFLAPFQAGVLYPPNVLGLLFPTAAAAMNFGVFLSFLWMTFGAYIFALHALQLERVPSLLMGVVFGCSAFVQAHTDHVNQLAAISWIPWIMALALMLLRRPELKHMIFLSICLGMQTLAGHPQYVVYTLVFLGIITIIYSVYYFHRRQKDESPSWVGIAFLIIAVGVGLGLASAQTLPSEELSVLSVRQMDPPDRMLRFSFPPKHLITLVDFNAFGNPVTGLHALDGGNYSYNFSEYCCYIGIIALIFALVAVVFLWKEFVVRCFIFLAMVSLLMAFGEYANGVFYRAFLFWFPGVEHMRVPARFLVFFVFSLAALAALGFNQLLFYLKERRRIRPSTLAPLRILILVVVFGELFFFSRYQMFRYQGSTDILKEEGPLLEYLRQNSGSYRVFRLLDEVQYGYDENRIGDETRQLAKRNATRLQLQRIQPNLNVLGDNEICRGYEEGLLPTLNYLNFMERYWRNLYNATPDSDLLGLMNVRYFLSDRPIIVSDRLDFRFKHEIQFAEDGSLVFIPREEHTLHTKSEQLRIQATYENLDYLPRFAWAEPLRRYYDLEALDVNPYASENNYAAGRAAPNLGYRREDYDPAEAQLMLGALRTEMLKMKTERPRNSPNTLIVTKPEGESGELLMLSAAYPGWVCRWEGGGQRLKRVNAVMMSCNPPADKRELRFSFEPFSFRLGLFVSLCFAMLLSGLALFPAFPQKYYFPGRKRDES